MPWKDARHSQKAVRRQFGKWNKKARKDRGSFLAECRAKAAALRAVSRRRSSSSTKTAAAEEAERLAAAAEAHQAANLEQQCAICIEDLTEAALCALPCCPTAIACKACMQKTAGAAGKDIRCPFCSETSPAALP